MLSRRNLLGLSLVIGFAVLAGDLNLLMAKGGASGVLQLQAAMSAGATKAKAKYEQRTNRRKFTFELEKGRPGTVLSIRVNGQVIASRQIDALGRAKVDFDTVLGNPVPVMSAGQVVSVWVGTNMLMSGAFQVLK